MAVSAKNISDTQHLATEASSNRSQYVIDKNNIALNGGLTDNRLKLLSAKNGAKLQALLDFKDKLHTKPVEEPTIIKAQNGAKLEQVEVSEEKSVIPEGALHKNKHDDFDLKVTPKGIPVVTVADDNVETLAEI